MQDLSLPMSLHICIRPQQLQHTPAVISNADSGADLAQLSCLLVQSKLNVGQGRERNCCTETARAAADDGDPEGFVRVSHYCYCTNLTN